MRIGVLVFVIAVLLAAQKPADFDVASVKVSPPIGGQNTFVGMRIDAGRVHIANFPLNAVILRAYGIEGDQIVGIPNEFRYPLAFEIDATFPPELKDQVPQMLQALLAERFKLVAHRETRPMPIYALVVAKGGPKMKVSQEETMSTRNPKRGHFEAKKVTISWLATLFHNSGWTDRPVVDMTGLSGSYDLVLDWTPDDVKSEDLAAPSLFTAVQEQLGLKLEPQMKPREILAIDHVEKPSEN